LLNLIYFFDKTKKIIKNFIFTIKISRKTFETQIARKYGKNTASSKLGHESPVTTRKKYIVPDAIKLEIDNPLNTIPNEDLLVVRKDKRPPWYDKKFIEKNE